MAAATCPPAAITAGPAPDAGGAAARRPKRCEHARARAKGRAAPRAPAAGARRPRPLPRAPDSVAQARSGVARRRRAQWRRSPSAPPPRTMSPRAPRTSNLLCAPAPAPLALTPSHQSADCSASSGVFRQLSQSAPSASHRRLQIPIRQSLRGLKTNSRPAATALEAAAMHRQSESTVLLRRAFDRAPRFSCWARGWGRVCAPDRSGARGPGRRATAAARPPKGRICTPEKSESHRTIQRCGAGGRGVMGRGS